MKKKIYPYLVLVACCGLIIVTFGFINTQGLYFDEMVKDLNVGRGNLSIFVTINFLISAIVASSLAIKIRERFNTKLVLAVSGSIMLAFYLLVPTFKSVYLFYLYGAVFGTVMAIIGNTFVVELLNSWFDKAGTVTGIAMAFSGVFGAIYAPIASSLIDSYGWRKAYYSYALIFVVVIVYSVLVIKKNEQVQLVKKEKAKKAFNKKLVLLALFYIAGGSVTALGNYISSYGVSVGLSTSQGALLSSSVSAGNLLLKLIFGYLCDKFGAFKASIVNYTLIALGLVMLLLLGSKSFILALVACFLIGSSYATQNVISQGLCKDLFGKQELSKFYSSLGVFSMISAFSTTMVGATYDLFSSYNYAILILLVCLTLGFILVIFDFKKEKK